MCPPWVVAWAGRGLRAAVCRAQAVLHASPVLAVGAVVWVCASEGTSSCWAGWVANSMKLQVRAQAMLMERAFLCSRC